jgi:hypothetical protein
MEEAEYRYLGIVVSDRIQSLLTILKKALPESEIDAVSIRDCREIRYLSRKLTEVMIS